MSDLTPTPGEKNREESELLQDRDSASSRLSTAPPTWRVPLTRWSSLTTSSPATCLG